MADVTVALGGGGVKGFAHMGVLSRLEIEGYSVKAVAGTSAGGIVGSVFAAGLDMATVSRELASINQRTLFGRLPNDGPSLLGLSGFINWLSAYLEDRTFQDLKIPFAVTAVDVSSRQEYILRQGLVRDAVLATIAIPGVFPPKRIGDAYLVDGGVLDPVPVAVARWLAPKLPVIAVCLSPTPEKWSELPNFTPPTPIPIPSPIRDQIARFRVSQAFQLFIDSMELTSHMVAETRMQIEKPDIIIRPAVHHFGILDRVDPQELFAAGERATEEALPQIRHSLTWHHQFSRRFQDSAPPGIVLSDIEPTNE